MHIFAHARLRLRPFGAAELVELRLLLRIGIRVFLQHIEAGRGHIAHPALVIDLHIVLRDALGRNLHEAAINSDSVVFVNHIVAVLELAIIQRLPIALAGR